MSIVETIRFVPTLQVIEIDGLPEDVMQSLRTRAKERLQGQNLRPVRLPSSLRGISYKKGQKLYILFSASKVDKEKASRLADNVLSHYGLRLRSFSSRDGTIWRVDVRLNMAITEQSLFELLSNQLRRLPGVLHVSWLGNEWPMQLSRVSLTVIRKPTPDLEGIIRHILA